MLVYLFVFTPTQSSVGVAQQRTAQTIARTEEWNEKEGGVAPGIVAMKYEIAVIGNDESAFEILNLAAGSGRRTVAVIPHIRHSAWMVTQALRRLTSDLLVDRTIQRKRIFARAARPRMLRSLLTRAITSELDEHLAMLENIGVDVRIGEARFEGREENHERLRIRCEKTRIEANHVVIATGVRRGALPVTTAAKRLLQPEALFSGRRLPSRVRVVGGGDLGAGLAALASLFGVETRLSDLPDFNSVMTEIAASAGVTIDPKWEGRDVARSSHEQLVDCRRIVGFTEHLNLTAAEIEPDENGQLWCADNMETWCPGIFGAGSVVGFSPESELPATAQAERIIGRISRTIPRPHAFSTRRARVSA